MSNDEGEEDGVSPTGYSVETSVVELSVVIEVDGEGERGREMSKGFSVETETETVLVEG